MSDTDESKSAEQRRARLRALREKRRAAPDADGGEAPGTEGEGDVRGRLMKAIAKKRGRKSGAAGPGRRAAAGGEQFPKLRQILARRRARESEDSEGGGADPTPEQQIEALKKRLQRLSDAVERTEAELAAARDSARAGGGEKVRTRKKAVAKKVAARARAARRKDND